MVSKRDGAHGRTGGGQLAAAYPSAPTVTVEPPVNVTLPSTASVEYSPAAMPRTVAAPSLALNTLT